MKINDLLKLDCRERENMDVVMTQLRKISFFKDRETITTYLMERYVDKIARNCPLQISSMMPCHLKNEILWWSIPIKRVDTQECIKVVSAYCIREGLAKAIIFMHAYALKYYGGANYD